MNPALASSTALAFMLLSWTGRKIYGLNLKTVNLKSYRVRGELATSEL
jgi:hypothetical protein